MAVVNIEAGADFYQGVGGGGEGAQWDPLIIYILLQTIKIYINKETNFYWYLLFHESPDLHQEKQSITANIYLFPQSFKMILTQTELL